MLFSSTLLIIFATILHKSNAVDVEKLCEGQRYGTLVPNPNDCNSFYVCQFVIQLTYCDIGLHFDRKNRVCNWPQFANCDWVEPAKPEKPSTNDDNNPVGPTVEPNIPSGESGKPNQGEDSKPAGESSEMQSSEDTTPEDVQTTTESEESTPVIDVEPQYPQVDASEENIPSTGGEIHTPGPSSAENPDGEVTLPSTVVDDVITDEPQTPSSISSENQESGLPNPEHTPAPPISEETDQQSSEEDSTDKQPPVENSSESPNSDQNVNSPTVEDSTDLPTTEDYSSHYWNLIASIVSVESSNADGFINNPTVGAHSPETGYPVDPMTGYDPKNVQCVHSGLYFLPHPSNCQKYYICAYRHLHLHSCGNDVIWNYKREQCELKGYGRCYSLDYEYGLSTTNTKLPTPFIDDHTEEATRKTTKPATRRPTTKTTKLPATTLSHKLPICPATRQVYLPNLDDCHRYFICIMGKPVLTSCPSGMHWDAVGEFCGRPSEVRCAHR